MLFVRIVFVGISFISSIVLAFVITESSIILAKYLPFYMLQDAKYIFFARIMFFRIFKLTSTFIVIALLYFLPSNLLMHSHDICFVTVLDSFIPVIMLKTFRFKSSVLFGTHTLLDRSLGVLQHLPKLSANG